MLSPMRTWLRLEGLKDQFIVVGGWVGWLGLKEWCYTSTLVALFSVERKNPPRGQT